MKVLQFGSALALGIVLGGSGSGLGVSQATAQARWEAYTYSPATAVAYKELEAMVAEFQSQTDGRVEVELSSGGTLPIKATNVTQAVGDGVLQLAGDGFYTGNVPLGGLLFLPGLILTPEELSVAFETIEPLLREEFAERGVELLSYYHYPLQVLFSPDELTSWEDMEGNKSRVTSPEQGEFVTRFGGIPVTLGSSEVAPALQRGIIDVVITASSAGARRYQDSLNYNFRIGPNLHTSFIIANAEAFGALSAEDQTLLRELAEAATGRINATLAEDEITVTKDFAEAGMTITEPTEADTQKLIETMRPYWDEWAEAHGPKAVAAVAEIRGALGR